ncbi:hypothetical protein BD413DRAFT_574807 [Trametes elegans]|nr:hypothetical protein BD413DRAFT_574807 [Trametes elegans]
MDMSKLDGGEMALARRPQCAHIGPRLSRDPTSPVRCAGEPWQWATWRQLSTDACGTRDPSCAPPVLVICREQTVSRILQWCINCRHDVWGASPARLWFRSSCSERGGCRLFRRSAMHLRPQRCATLACTVSPYVHDHSHVCVRNRCFPSIILWVAFT